MRQECEVGCPVRDGSIVEWGILGSSDFWGSTFLSSVGPFYSLITPTEENSEATGETGRVFILSSKSLLTDTATKRDYETEASHKKGWRKS